MQQIDWAAMPTDMADGFLSYHAANPHIADELERLALDLVNHGHEKIGMGMLFEVLRWHYALSSHTCEPFKLNNNYRAFYSRMLEHRHEKLVGVFNMRRSVSDGVTIQ